MEEDNMIFCDSKVYKMYIKKVLGTKPMLEAVR